MKNNNTCQSCFFPCITKTSDDVLFAMKPRFRARFAYFYDQYVTSIKMAKYSTRNRPFTNISFAPPESYLESHIRGPDPPDMQGI